jgi:hypothetical protein
MQFCGEEFPLDTQEIDCVNRSVDSLAPLSRFERLRRLRLWSTDPHRDAVHSLADLSPLANLENLEVLEIPIRRLAICVR